jgi:LPXTG-motif cell wall-anchored protein
MMVGLAVLAGGATANADRTSAVGTVDGVSYVAKYLCSTDHTQIHWHATATNTDTVAHDVALVIDMGSGTDGTNSATLQPGQSLSVSVDFTVPNSLQFYVTVDNNELSITGEGWAQQFADVVCAFTESTTPDTAPQTTLVDQIPSTGTDSGSLLAVAVSLVVCGGVLMATRRRPA